MAVCIQLWNEADVWSESILSFNRDFYPLVERSKTNEFCQLVI